MIIKRNRQKINQKSLPVEKDTIDGLIKDVPKSAEKSSAKAPVQKEDTSDIFAGFNFDEIDFNQRAERRRGDRRRGYRRVDDRNLISRAQAEAIGIKEISSKEGFKKGLEEAQKTVFELKEAIEGFFEYKEQLYAKLSEDILDISIEVAEKIIKREVEVDETILYGIVEDALKNLAKEENKIILKVSPTDVEYTKEIVPELLSSGQFEAKIFVSGDPEVEEGSAVIETSNGIIDANISTQLELIKEAFKKI